MLFNSLIFIFEFMPIVLAGYYLLGFIGQRQLAILWLAGASLAFYAYGDTTHLPLLLVSIVFNYSVGTTILNHIAQGKPARWLFVLGIGGDILTLVWFKYINFLLWNFAALRGESVVTLDVALPIGISFFTFTQIAYLADCYRGGTKAYRPHHYLLFVTYFPHLIAGPILLHKELIPQFWQQRPFRFDLARLLVGLTIFAIGLFKKTILADGVSVYADTTFAAAASGQPMDSSSAWIGAFAYTMQIYFDFSGYCDIAIGLSHMLGFRLPLNFWSPYKSASIVDFWRRWHMTLSRFLADHIYKPLGGNRRGSARRYLNLMTTMLLGGLWHGAGWTFVLWGALHGVYLTVNHAWRHLVKNSSLRSHADHPAWHVISILVTFTAVLVAWVFFRARSLPAAWAVLSAMFGLRTGETLFMSRDLVIVHLAVLALIVFCTPNTYQLMRRYSPYANGRPSPALAWRMRPAWALATSCIFLIGVVSMFSSAPSPFLYFQF